MIKEPKALLYPKISNINTFQESHFIKIINSDSLRYIMYFDLNTIVNLSVRRSILFTIFNKLDLNLLAS